MATTRETEYFFEQKRNDGCWIPSIYLNQDYHPFPILRKVDALEHYKRYRDEAKRVKNCLWEKAYSKARAKRFLNTKHRLVQKTTTTTTKRTDIDENTYEEFRRVKKSTKVVKTL